MRKWKAAAALGAVLLVSACKKESGAAGQGEARDGTPAKEALGTPAPSDPTVPGGFTVDTQKVENAKGSGQTVNEPD